MRVKIGFKENKNTIDIKKGKNEDNFDIIRRLENMQMEEDILMCGRCGKANYGIKSLCTENGITTNLVTENSVNVDNADGSFVIGGRAGITGKETQNLTIDGEDMGTKIQIALYEPGYILSTGTKAANLFGVVHDSYLNSIGRRRIKTSTKYSAKVFSDVKKLKTYIEKNKEIFSYMAKEHGYVWSFEPSCDEYANDEKELLAGKKGEKIKALKTEIEALLNEVNSAEKEEEFEEIPDATPENMKAEAVWRMTKAALWDRIINRFRKDGTVFMSEFGGIIYDLDDGAKEAVKKITDKGFLPYHVIKTTTEIGVMYDVLYVGNDPELWAYERTDRDGIASVYTYNSTDPMCSEYGSIGVISSNGGMVRTA